MVPRPIRAAHPIRENDWYPVRGLLGYLDRDSAERLESVAVEASLDLKASLGLREIPVVVERRGEGLEIRVTGIAGTLRLGSWVIDVAPKFVDSAAAVGDWQASVLSIVNRVRGRHLTYSHVVGMSVEGSSFVDHMAIAFADAVDRASIGEPIHLYRTREETSPVLRGNLSLPRQLRNVLSRPHMLECDVQYLDTDNPFNHLLHWACSRFSQLVLADALRQRLDETRSLLPPIGGPAQEPTQLTLQAPPQYRAWEEAIDISVELARGQAHSTSRGGADGYGFVLAMETLFERFVDVSLRRALREWHPDMNLVTQDSKAFAFPVDSGRKYFTRPDDVIYANDGPAVVIDAKYKRLVPSDTGSLRKPRNPDVYQLLAAMTAHRCTRGLLVYPQVSGDDDLGDGAIRSWRVPTFGDDVHVAAVALNIASFRSRSDLADLDRRLAEIVASVTGPVSSGVIHAAV